jgi:hypothetical protein
MAARETEAAPQRHTRYPYRGAGAAGDDNPVRRESRVHVDQLRACADGRQPAGFVEPDPVESAQVEYDAVSQRGIARIAVAP